MKTKKSILLICLLASQMLFAQNKSKSIDSLLNYCKQNKLYSGGVLVMEKDNILYNNTNGYANTNVKTLYTSSHSQSINSLGKQFTAIAILILKEKELLSLDDKAKKYLSDFPYENVTIRHLLTHSSGIEDYYQLWKKQPTIFPANLNYFSNKDILDLLVKNKISLNFEPNTQSSYSNTGYVILAMIIEKVTGKSYSEFMEQTIFKPLKMKYTYLYNPKEKGNYQVMPFTFTYKDDELGTYQNKIEKFTVLTGDGGIYTNNNDIIKWNNALEQNTLIKESSWQEAIAGNILADGKEDSFGFGWVISKSPITKKKAIMHAGQGDGFKCMIYKEMEDKNMIFLMSNNNSPYIGEIYKTILKIIHNQPYSFPKIGYELVLEKQINEIDIEIVMKEFLSNKEKVTNEFYIDEKAINRLGYKYFDAGKLKEAIIIFSINSELFPQSKNAKSSLEEASLKIKQ